MIYLAFNTGHVIKRQLLNTSFAASRVAAMVAFPSHPPGPPHESGFSSYSLSKAASSCHPYLAPNAAGSWALNVPLGKTIFLEKTTKQVSFFFF